MCQPSTSLLVRMADWYMHQVSGLNVGDLIQFLLMYLISFSKRGVVADFLPVKETGRKHHHHLSSESGS